MQWHTSGMPADVKITVRLPVSVHKMLVKLAEREARSLNGEIVYLLQRAAEAELKRR